jgi:methionine-rich copper-binding protein CopC
MLRRGRPAALAAPLAGPWLLASGPATAAHGVLKSSGPAGGSSLERAPAAVTLRFESGGRVVAAGPAQPLAGRSLTPEVPPAPA